MQKTYLKGKDHIQSVMAQKSVEELRTELKEEHLDIVSDIYFPISRRGMHVVE